MDKWYFLLFVVNIKERQSIVVMLHYIHIYIYIYIYIYTQLFPNKSETFIFLKFRSKFYNLLAGTEKLFLVKH